MNYDIEKYQIGQRLREFFGSPECKYKMQEEDRVIALKQELAECGMMLCGGAINSTFTRMAVNDLDFYVRNPDDIDRAHQLLQKYFPEIPYKTTNAITFKRQSTKSRKMWRAQLITRFTGTPEEILDTFDFTITQGSFDFKTDSFFFGKRFFQDIASRRITYLGKSQYPICAMYRTKKYQDRGYNLPGSTIMHIALSIVRLKIETYRDLKEQLMGIDTSHLAGLLGTPAYADELPVDYGKFMVEAFQSIEGIEQNPDDFAGVYEYDNQ